MVKKLLLTILLCFFVQADTIDEVSISYDDEVVSHTDLLEEKIISFMDDDKYRESKNLISYLFSSKSSFYKNSEIDAILVLDTLKSNGLLNLFSKEPQEIELVFNTNFNSITSIKVIVESLNSMGYTFFLTKRIYKSLEGLQWHIVISTQHTPNPILLNENLNSRGSEILDVSKEDNVWSYKIDTQYAVIDSIDIQKNVATQLKKPLVPYWIKTADAKRVTIRSSQADHWHPRISFYDGAMMLIDKVEFDQKKPAIRIDIPQKSFYIKIEDKYTLDNIKRGLSIQFN